jgi:O-antigen ligase
VLSPWQISLISAVIVGLLAVSVLIIALGRQYTTIGFYLLGGIIAIALAAAIVARPELGALALTFTIFTNISSVMGSRGPFSVNKVLVALVLLSILANRLITGKTQLRLRRTEILLFIFIGVRVFTFFVADDQNVVLANSIDFIKDFGILLCMIYAFDSLEQWKRLGWILVSVAAGLALLGLYQVITGDYAQHFWGFATTHFDPSIASGASGVRLEGPLEDPNFYGQIMVAILPLAIYRIFAEKRPSLKLFGALAAGLITFAVIYSYSRGAFLALVCVGILILSERRVGLLKILAAVVALLILVQLLPETYRARISTISLINRDETSVYEDDSLRGRTSELRAALGMWSDHPFLGVGVGNYRVHYQEYASEIGLEYRNEDRQAHSLYLEVLSETGLIGTLVFIAFLISLFTSLAETRRKLSRMPGHRNTRAWVTAIMIGLSAYLVTSIFLHSDYFRYFILLLSLGAAATHLVEELWAELQEKERKLVIAQRTL